MALQEFLASYAVQVDEDGARRLQAVLEKNRESGAALAEVFSAARNALASLKKELSESASVKDYLSGWRGGAAGGLPLTGASGSAGGGRSENSAVGRASGGRTVITAAADLSAAEEAFGAFRVRMEAMRPRLSVNTSGITSAVSSAVASVRAMLSSIRITVPVTARAQLDTSGLPLSGGGGGSRGGTGNRVQLLGTGGRVASPTLAMIAEEGKAEYVIPTDNEGRAVPLLRSLIAELSDSARGALFSGAFGGAGLGAGAGSGGGKSPASVQAPVNIHVTAPAGSPEAVAQSIYDTAQRSLLKTLKGVFA